MIAPRRPVLFAIALLGVAALVAVWNTTSGSPVAAAATQWNLVHKCTYCHDPHGGPNTANLRLPDVEVLCRTCHGPGGMSAKKAQRHEGFTCLVCHDKHRNVTNRTGGENIKLLGPKNASTGLATIQTPDGPRQVTFESRGTQAGQPTLHSFSDHDEDQDGVYDGACEVCHLNDNGTQFEVDNHNFGQTCTSCHLHSTGFRQP